MSDPKRTGQAILRLSSLPGRQPHAFTHVPDAAEIAGLTRQLELSALRKVRLEGRLRPVGARDWDLEARLGASVVQPCRLTMEPVTTRIEEPVVRRYRAEVAPVTEAEEMEMPEDDTVEELPASLDLSALLAEALALAVPAYPQAPGAEGGAAIAAPPGEPPLTDDALKPFAGLADLRRSLGGEDRAEDPPDEA